MSRPNGIVYLVGAGPGDPGLITVRGMHLLRQADVIVHDRLIAYELLGHARRGAEIIAAGKSLGRHTLSQDEINELLIDRARRGALVVRLKGGDPFVFGRGFEELAACREAGVDCVVVPGVTSAIAAPAAAGIPVTHRNLSRTFAVLTAKSGDDAGAPEIDFSALAGVDCVCVLMGRENLAWVTEQLIRSGRDPATPAACVEWGTTARQRVATGTLASIVSEVERDELKAPMVTVVGAVAAFAAVQLDLVEHPQRHASAAKPLLGKRVVVTRSRTESDELSRLLLHAGAIPIPLPLVRIDYAVEDAEVQPGKVRLKTHLVAPQNVIDVDRDPGTRGGKDGASGTHPTWVAFTSVHGVIGYFNRLRSAKLDARALGGARVAAVGEGTARALRKRGITPDLVPTTFTAEALATRMLAEIGDASCRVLLPRGDRALPTLPTMLRQGGVDVEELIVYRSLEREWPKAHFEAVAADADVILLYSPSAVQSWMKHQADAPEAIIACLGPTTADEARRLGLRVGLVPDEYTSAGMVAALERFFQPQAVSA